MKTSNKLLLIALGLVMLVIIGSMIWLKVFMKNDIDAYKFTAKESTTYLRPESKIKVELKEISANLDVVGWDKDSIMIQVDYAEKHESESVRMDLILSDSTVDLSLYMADGLDGVKAKCLLKVPKHIDLDYNVDGGSVSLMDISGNLNGNLGGGTFRARDLAGNIRLNTGGGIISIDNMDGFGKVNTGGGTIRIHNLKGNFNIETGGGKVTVEESDFNGKVSTGGGKIALSEVQGDIRVETGGGKIVINDSKIGGHVQTGGGSIVVNRAIDGIKVETGGGSISLNDVGGWIEAKSGGGEITANILQVEDLADYHANIESGGGDIYLKLPKSLGYEFDLSIETRKRNSEKYKIVSEFDIETGIRDISASDVEIYGTGIFEDGSNLIRLETNSGNLYLTKE